LLIRRDHAQGRIRQPHCGEASDGVRCWQNRASPAANTMQLFYWLAAQWWNIFLFLVVFKWIWSMLFYE
jgi:hypothetical protein